MARLELDVTELIKTHRGQMFKFHDPPNKWDVWAASLREGGRYDWVNDENREAVRQTIPSQRGAYTLIRSPHRQGLSRGDLSPGITRSNAAMEWGEQKWGDRELTAAEHWDDETLQALIVETIAMRWLAKSTRAECL